MTTEQLLAPRIDGRVLRWEQHGDDAPLGVEIEDSTGARLALSPVTADDPSACYPGADVTLVRHDDGWHLTAASARSS